MKEILNVDSRKLLLLQPDGGGEVLASLLIEHSRNDQDLGFRMQDAARNARNEAICK